MKAFKVKGPSGTFVDGIWPSRKAIPEKVPDAFEFYFDPEDGEIVQVTIKREEYDKIRRSSGCKDRQVFHDWLCLSCGNQNTDERTSFVVCTKCGTKYDTIPVIPDTCVSCGAVEVIAATLDGRKWCERHAGGHRPAAMLLEGAALTKNAHPARFPELDSIVVGLASEVSREINARCSSVGDYPQCTYKRQYVLEELIKKLQEKV